MILRAGGASGYTSSDDFASGYGNEALVVQLWVALPQIAL